jgi:mannose-1-phosphate guanylyltransferase
VINLSRLFAVILAGGKGERFWPMSRANRPKQLLPLVSNKSLLEETIARISSIAASRDIMISTRSDLQQTILASIPALKTEQFLVEPVGRNSGPAILLAAMVLAKLDTEGIMIVLPSDHYIPEKEAFIAAVKAGIEFLVKNPSYLLTFGIVPTRPETGYGYIELGSNITQFDEIKLYDAMQFREKPDAATARQFLNQGTFMWNSGMFMWKIKSVINAFKKHAPEIYLAVNQYVEGDRQVDQLFEASPSISVDYAIMEKAEKVGVIKANFRWDDMGSWASLLRLLPTDEQDNVNVGNNLLIETKSSVAYSEDGRIAIVGMNDIVVVRSGEYVLVLPADQDQRVRDVVKLINNHQ